MDSEFLSCRCQSANIMVRKATGSHLKKATSLEKTQSPVSHFCYLQNQVCDAVYDSGEVNANCSR